MKYEEVYLKAYADGREARVGLREYFRFYNTQRPHQALEYKTPAEVYVDDKEIDPHRDVLQSRETATPMEGIETADPDLNLAGSLSN